MSAIRKAAQRVVDLRYSNAGWDELNDAIGELCDALKQNSEQPNIQGVELRDWFAGMALQAMISKTPFVPRNPDWKETMNRAAYSAYGYADAMLAARERKEGE